MIKILSNKELADKVVGWSLLVVTALVLYVGG